jgi:hypothetical protein
MNGLSVGRYQYATSIPLAILLARMIAVVPAPARMPGWAITAALVAVMAAGVFRSERPLQHYEESRTETARVLSRIEELVHQKPTGSVAYIANRPFKPATIYPPRLLPGWAAAFAIFHPDASLDGRTVRFVIHDPEDLAVLQRGRRGDLFVGRDEPREAAPTR